MKILVYQNNSNYQNNLTRILTENGYEILNCQTYNEFQEMFKTEIPAFSIIDWNHPELKDSQIQTILEPFLDEDYNPIIFLAEEHEVTLLAKETRVKQVYWFSKKSDINEIVNWLKEQVELKDKYTQVVRKKKCLQESCHITTSILNAVPSALVVIDDQMKITNFNHSFIRLFELDQFTVIQEHICESIHGNQSIVPLSDHIKTCPFIHTIDNISGNEGNMVGEEVMLTDKHGEKRCFMVITSRLPATNYKLLIDIRDVTERKKQEEDMALRDRLASLGGLSIGVAHEINNPNGAIRMGMKNINMILEMITPLIEEIKNNNPGKRFGALTIDKILEKLPLECNRVLNATDRVAAVVANLKNFGRKDQSGQHVQININNTINNAIQLTNHVLNETCTLELQLDEKISTVKGNETEIEQVLINLISNACDSIKEKKLEAEKDYIGRISIKSFYKKSLFIEITDNGTGIKEKVKNKIFNPYYTCKPYGVGTGVGLSISQNIIKKHNGNLACLSEEGKGATFRIEFP